MISFLTRPRSAAARAASLLLLVVAAACSDGADEGTDRCAGVVCVAEACREAGACDPSTGACSQGAAKPDTSLCDDGQAETINDACLSGACVGKTRCEGVTCAAKDPCHEAGVCDPATGLCSDPQKADKTACDDGVSHTVQDACMSGVCSGISICEGMTCQPSDQCHAAGVCVVDSGLCTNPAKADATPCDDGDVTTIDDACVSGVCLGVSRCLGVTCSALDQCHEAGICDPTTGTCTQPLRADTSVCDDGAANTVGDQCSAGVCSGVDHCLGVTCMAIDQCHESGVCDHATGLCSHPAAADTTPCDDGDVNTAMDKCSSGVCAGVDLCLGVTCVAIGPCFDVGTCNHANGQCINPVKPDQTACDDGNASTVGDACVAGVCHGTVPSGETCADAMPLAAPFAADLSTDGFVSDFGQSIGCGTGLGADRVFYVDVPAGKRLYASVRGIAGFDPSISVVGALSDCGATPTCLDWSDVGLSTSLNFVVHENTTSDILRYYLLVDSFADSSGAFSLRVAITDPLPGDTCGGAEPISLPFGSASLTGQTVDLYDNDMNSGVNCAGFTGGERVYSVVVPANALVVAVATPEAGFDLSLNAIDVTGTDLSAACTGQITCSAAANASGDGGTESIVLRNTGASSKTFLVTVEAGNSNATPGRFSVALETIPVIAGDTCADVAVVTVDPSTTLTSQPFGVATNDYGAGIGCAGTAGPDRGYAIDVPAGKVLTVSAVASASGPTFNPSINLVAASACAVGQRTCLASADTSGASETVRYFNNGSATERIVAFVESASSGVAWNTSFDVTFALSDPPVGETCSNAPTVGSGTQLDQTLLDYGNDFGSGPNCYGFSGPDRVYKVVVAAGERLTATVTPKASSGGVVWDPAINFQLAMACSGTGRSCLAGADARYSGSAESASWTNLSPDPVDVFVVVETYSSATPAANSTRAFDLEIAVAVPPPPPADDLCEDLTTLISTDETLSAQKLSGYANNYSTGNGSSCEFTKGLDRAYRVRIPAGTTLTAVVTPDATWDPTISLVLGSAAACGVSTCAASVDNGYEGDAETLVYANTGSSDVDGFLVVDSWLDAPTVTWSFTLAITY